MAVVYDDNISDHISGSLSSSATTLTIQSDVSWPVIDGNDHAWLTLINSAGLLEIVRATNRNGNTMAIERGQSGTVALAFNNNDLVEMRVCQALLQDIQGGGTGTITHTLWFGGLATTIGNFTAAMLTSPGITQEDGTAGTHTARIDGSTLADGWTAYLIVQDPQTITEVTISGFHQPGFFLTANTRTITEGSNTYNIYSTPNNRAGAVLNLVVTIA